VLPLVTFLEVCSERHITRRTYSTPNKADGCPICRKQLQNHIKRRFVRCGAGRGVPLFVEETRVAPVFAAAVGLTAQAKSAASCVGVVLGPEHSIYNSSCRFGGGDRLVLGRRPLFDLLHQPRAMMNVEQYLKREPEGETEVLGGNIPPKPLSTASNTQCDLDLNPGRCSGKPVTNCLSYSTAFFYFYPVRINFCSM
jgi:hypothetical protein